MPLSDFGTQLNPVAFTIKEKIVQEGDDVAELLGFTHYVEPEHGATLGTPGRKFTLWQRILKFFGFAPKPYGPKGSAVYDVESLKNYPRVFAEGEEVIVTEKIHGSNARYLFDGKKFWVGSHKKWWKDSGNIWEMCIRDRARASHRRRRFTPGVGRQSREAGRSTKC